MKWPQQLNVARYYHSALFSGHEAPLVAEISAESYGNVIVRSHVQTHKISRRFFRFHHLRSDCCCLVCVGTDMRPICDRNFGWLSTYTAAFSDVWHLAKSAASVCTTSGTFCVCVCCKLSFILFVSNCCLQDTALKRKQNGIFSIEF